MFDVATFLIRWLFLANIARDVAEIQTLPCQPYYPAHPPPEQHLSRQQLEEIWRDDCIRGILSHPAGMQRLLVLDAYRVELVKMLSQKLKQSDDTLKRLALSSSHTRRRPWGVSTIRRRSEEYDDSSADDDDEEEEEEEEDDPFYDADLEVLEAFGQTPPKEIRGTETSEYGDATERGTASNATNDSDISDKLYDDRKKATLVIARNGTATVVDSRDDKDSRASRSSARPTNDREDSAASLDSSRPSAQDLLEATNTRRDVRDFLPQLVSAILKEPPAFDPSLVNPSQRLRQLILHRCQQDPSWGTELCWLLEAEVGRAWKTLFEHRQQTGRRLIVVLPAEKAAVLAKIGTEKREAFELLQDAEQATAYGYVAEPDATGSPVIDEENNEGYDGHPVPRLPSSLSLRRCSFFGDTMHFIDRLTKISLDLRMVPVLQRREYLQDALYEMNRRIRRRMVTRGDVSLDVEDNRSPYDWPTVQDLTVDMLRYSVFFPLVPQTGVWPDGRHRPIASQSLPQSTEAMRVLNVVVPEAKILASRERCPYLVHLEVADTHLDSSDARLYASGASDLGSTIEEALGMSAAAGAAAATKRNSYMHPGYDIPNELLAKGQPRQKTNEPTDPDVNQLFPRGGWQNHEAFTGDEENAGYIYPSPYDDVRQHEYEQLHNQLQSQQLQQQVLPPQATSAELRHSATKGDELLDRVFGKSWDSKCNEIREASPYGHLKGWRLASFIMKAGEDIRREALVMQIISRLRTWFRQEIVEEQRPFMRPYTIMCVGGDAGLLKCLKDVKSVDEVKKATDGFVSLRDYFERAYGPPTPPHHYQQPPRPDGSISFETAQKNFLRSLVGYSLVCYILQIKDRHNANILLDREGHIMHIDFGFVMGDVPKMGRVPIFSERAPFKLSNEFWEVLGGWNISRGGLGVRFCKMFELAFSCASAHADEIATLVEGTMLALNSSPSAARSSANGVRYRLRMRGPPDSREQKAFIMDLVNAALTSWGTSTYDWLQRNMNGYQ